MCLLIFTGKKGFGLVQVVMAVAIGAAASLFFATLLMQMRKEISLIEDKFAILSLEKSLIQLLSNPQVCSWQLELNNSGSQRVIDLSGTPNSEGVYPNAVVSLGALRIGMNNSSPILVQPGQSLTGVNRLSVDKVELKNVRAVDTMSGIYQGTINVSFVSNENGFPFRPISLEQAFNIDPLNGSSNSREIKSCGTSASTSSPSANEVSPVAIACRRYTGTSNIADFLNLCPSDVGFGTFYDVWTSVDLSTQIPSGTSSVHLRFITIETSVWVRPNGSGLSLGPETLAGVSINNTAGISDLWIDINPASPIIDIRAHKMDPPSGSFEVQLVGYK